MPQNLPLPDLLTVAETAAALNLSPRSVQRRIAAGLIPARKAGNGGTAPYLIRREDVERLAATEPAA